MVEQHRDHRRGERQHRHAVVADEPGQADGIERPLQHDRSGAAVEDQHVVPGDVAQRERGGEHVVVADGSGRQRGVDRGDEIRVREHGELRRSRRATRADEPRDVVGGAGRRRELGLPTPASVRGAPRGRTATRAGAVEPIGVSRVDVGQSSPRRGRASLPTLPGAADGSAEPTPARRGAPRSRAPRTRCSSRPTPRPGHPARSVPRFPRPAASTRVTNSRNVADPVSVMTAGVSGARAAASAIRSWRSTRRSLQELLVVFAARGYASSSGSEK